MIFMAHLVWSMCSLSAGAGQPGARLQAAGCRLLALHLPLLDK
jgi:hypothetical protein